LAVPDGASLVEAADAFMAGQSNRNPLHMMELFVPGFGPEK
jgi:hypothetical protein